MLGKPPPDSTIYGVSVSRARLLEEEADVREDQAWGAAASLAALHWVEAFERWWGTCLHVQGPEGDRPLQMWRPGEWEPAVTLDRAALANPRWPEVVLPLIGMPAAAVKRAARRLRARFGPPGPPRGRPPGGDLLAPELRTMLTGGGEDDYPAAKRRRQSDRVFAECHGYTADGFKKLKGRARQAGLVLPGD